MTDAETIEKLRAERDGWHCTALSMRDAAFYWQRDGVSRQDRIERMYFDAALFGRYTPVYRDDIAVTVQIKDAP